jgi:protocatechuate 3,4-dioxygenase alpha subunit
VSRILTPSQTVGPFFGFGLPRGGWGPNAPCLGTGRDPTRRLPARRTRRAGADGLIEGWRGVAADIRGFARAATDAGGRYSILTVKPGVVRDARGSVHAPHIALSVFARGLLKRAVTRVYFPDEDAANETDPVLAAVGDRAARATLIARAVDGGYELDIRLQGEGETVFFDV